MDVIKRTGVKSFDHELESESFSCFLKDERKALDKEFKVKIWTLYSLYTWLLTLAVITITVVIIVVCLSFTSPLKYLVFISAIGYIPLFIFIFNILKTTKKKYRYFLFINQKLKNEGFNDFYFRSYMNTLCYRLIIKDQLKKYGFENHYQYLMDNFSTNKKTSEFVTREALKELVGDDYENAEVEIE